MICLNGDEKEINKANDLTSQGLYKGWVIDGNYAKVRHINWNQTNLFIWLDYAQAVRFIRLTYRIICRWWFHVCVCNGNYESLWSQAKFWSTHSLYYWMFLNKLHYDLLEVFKKNMHVTKENNFIDISKASVLRSVSPKATDTWLKDVIRSGNIEILSP